MMTASQYIKYDIHKRSDVIAYVAWFILGLVGVHRLYLDRFASGIVMLVLTLSIMGFPITLVWWAVDGFLIPGMIREENTALAVRIGAVPAPDAQIPAAGNQE